MGTYAEHRATDRVTRLLWALILPRRARKLRLTVAGWGVLITGGGLTAAAYNNASNILFLSLALLLATMAMGVILARWNLRRIESSLLAPEFLVAGESATVRIRLTNTRRQLPAYAIRVDVRDSGSGRTEELFSSDAIAPGGYGDYPWVVTPARRGLLTLRIESLRSSHPFGLLDIAFGHEKKRVVPVRPAPVPYSFDEYEARKLPERGSRTRRGEGGDTAYLRAYRAGDAQRLIHWRASAKRGALLVRETETADDHAYALRFDPAHFAGEHEAAFEKACSLVVALAADLWKHGRLASVAIGDEPEVAAHRPGELNRFLDRLATIAPGSGVRRTTAYRADTLTFHPGPGDIVHVRLQNRTVGEA